MWISTILSHLHIIVQGIATSMLHQNTKRDTPSSRASIRNGKRNRHGCGILESLVTKPISTSWRILEGLCIQDVYTVAWTSSPCRRARNTTIRRHANDFFIQKFRTYVSATQFPAKDVARFKSVQFIECLRDEVQDGTNLPTVLRVDLNFHWFLRTTLKNFHSWDTYNVRWCAIIRFRLSVH